MSYIIIRVLKKERNLRELMMKAMCLILMRKAPLSITMTLISWMTHINALIKNKSLKEMLKFVRIYS